MDLGPFLQAHAPRGRALYLANFEDAGDSLIALGTAECLKQQGLQYRPVRDPKLIYHSNVICAGGGALVGYYPRSEAAVLALLRNQNHVIVLPHTIRCLNREILAFRGNLSVFCREKETCDYIRHCGGFRYVGLDHDMAFHARKRLHAVSKMSAFGLVLPAISGGTTRDKARVLMRIVPALRCYQLWTGRGRDVPGRHLNCFRTDVERGRVSVPPDNRDISRVFALGSEHLGGILLSSCLLLASLEQFDEIHTDRLHCCIGAALLGKRVQFYANSYYKNRAVFEHSLQDRGFSVTFHDTTELRVSSP